MTSVLVVDDVPDYCEEVAFGLAREGYEVVTANSGREAIITGTLMRPNIVVTDWMLKDHVDGLDVVDALRLVCPSVQAILITGFASQDLRLDADLAEVFDFLEKPFRLEEIRKAVNAANEKKKWWGHRLQIGFVQVDMNGDVVFANAAAEEMMGKTDVGPFAPSISDYFSVEDSDNLDRALEDWCELHPVGKPQTMWMVRGRTIPEGEGRIYVLLDEQHRGYRTSALVRRLLGLPEASRPGLELHGHLLVVDDYESVRRVMGDIFKNLHCVCHTAQTYEEAVRLFAHDSDIKYVFLDHQLPGCDPKELISRMKTQRPGIKVIGTSAYDGREDFQGMGIDYFLQKPWREEEFVELLGRLKKQESS